MSQPYSMYTLIQKKRDGGILESEEIKWIISSLVKKEIPDYQMSSLLMAIYLKGMTVDETAALTDAMLYSGKVITFNDPLTVDKHSTGGVGDKASFILAPMASAAGAKVPMIAGRGLGHTGGTVDKIEAIEGFNTKLSVEEFKKQLLEKHLVLIGQTDEIAPADKIVYALRDVTATIESIPLITASIMSKKLAEGPKSIVMDIKTGQGAFMSKLGDAKKLATSLRNTAKRFDRNMATFITDMNQPLGHAVGNSLEIIECIETLKGKGPKDITDLSIELTAAMIFLSGVASTEKKAKVIAKKQISSGSALEKFRELIKNQGGNERVIDDYTLLPIAEKITEVRAIENGYISRMDNKAIGLCCVDLGGGRHKKEDIIDPSVGLIVPVKIGQKVKKGDLIAKIYHHESQSSLVKEIINKFNTQIIKIQKLKPKKVPQLIYDIKYSWS